MNYRVAVVHGANPKEVHGQNRAHAGAGLHNEGKVQIVVTTGKYEADDLAQIVFKDGVPTNAIRTEKKARTTYQNLSNLVSEIFPKIEDDDHHFELSYLISQEWHKERLLYVARHVLGRRYPHEFYPAVDGREKDDIDADARLEKLKMLVDRTTLFLPVGRGLLNSLAYYTLSRVRRQ